MLMDPAKQARRVLKEIDRELARAERMKTLWEDYAAALRQALAKHEATTRPADGKKQRRRTDGE
jgi:hypothetical protein